MPIIRYRKEFCRPPNSRSEHLRCVAYLDTDISDLLPYLNRTLNGHQYFTDPPALTLKLPGKLVTLHANDISINIVHDEFEADTILEWLKEKANDTWNRRHEIQPKFAVASKPRVLNVLRLLPKTNCGKCGYSTCMVFAVMICEHAALPHDCLFLDDTHLKEIDEYIGRF